MPLMSGRDDITNMATILGVHPTDHTCPICRKGNSRDHYHCGRCYHVNQTSYLGHVTVYCRKRRTINEPGHMCCPDGYCALDTA